MLSENYVEHRWPKTRQYWERESSERGREWEREGEKERERVEVWRAGWIGRMGKLTKLVKEKWKARGERDLPWLINVRYIGNKLWNLAWKGFVSSDKKFLIHDVSTGMLGLWQLNHLSFTLRKVFSRVKIRGRHDMWIKLTFRHVREGRNRR